MCYPLSGMMHIKEPLLLIGKSSPCGGSGFPLSLFEWSFTICLTQHNRTLNVFSAPLNKTFPSFHTQQCCTNYVVVECPFTVRWVVGSIPRGESIELFFLLVSTS